MTKEEIEALRAQMAQIEEESRRKLYAQMDRLSSDERMTEEERDGQEAYAALDMAVYARKVFGMFSGEEVSVQLRFENHLVGAVLDRLGRDVMLIADGEDHFTVRTNVVVSPQFFAWVTGFGSSAQIIGPDEVVSAMRQHIESVAQLYRS